MKVVLDTNVLISGIFWGGKPAQILELLIEDKLTLIASKEVMDEYLAGIGETAKRLERGDLYLQWNLALAAKVSLINVRKSFHICRDPDDNKFLDCAVSGKAKYLVSGDHDLLSLGQVMSIPIIKPAAFLSTLS